MTTPDTDWAELIEQRVANVERGLAENTALTRASAETTAEVRDILNTGRALFKFADRFGRVLAWTAKTAAAVGALWAGWHTVMHGKPPGA